MTAWSPTIKDAGVQALVADYEHVQAAAVLRENFGNRPPTSSHLDVEVQVADLNAYDAAFGTREEVA